MTRRHRLIQVIGWVLSALLLLSGVRLLLVMTDETLGASRWNSSDYGGARSAFVRTTRLNPLGSWIGHFNVGTADYKLGNYQQAADDFRHALATAPADRRCMVALNLSWSWETLGDAQRDGGDQAHAEASWTQAKKALSDVNCPDASTSPSSSPSTNSSTPSPSAESSAGKSASSQPSSQDSSGQSSSQDSESQQSQRDQTMQRVQQKINQAQQAQSSQQQSTGQQQQEQLQQQQQEAQSQNAQSQATAPAGNPTGRNW